MGKAGGEKQGCGLSQNSSNRQNTSGNDTINTSGQYYGTDHSPFTRSQSECALTVALRNGLKTLLGSTHDRRKVHNYQCQGTCQQGSLHIQELAEEQHANQSIDNRRNTGQGFCCIFNYGNQLFIGCILGQINCRPYTKRQNNQQGCKYYINCVQDIRQNSDTVRQITWWCSQQLEGNIGKSLNKHISDQKKNKESSESCGDPHQYFHHPNIKHTSVCHSTMFHLKPPYPVSGKSLKLH